VSRGFVTAVYFAVTLAATGVYLDARQVPKPAPLLPAAPIAPAGQAPARDNSQIKIPIGTGTISGVVLSSTTGRPVGKARLSLNGTESGAAPGSELGLSRSVITDGQGQFTFGQLPAGKFSLSASKTHYLSASYGQKRPERSGTPIQLTDGQQFKDITLRLWSTGAITGVILDEDGEAAMNTQVRAMRHTLRNGVRQLTQSNQASTDDRGVYRIFGLAPGDYVVSAVSSNQDRAQSDGSAAAIEHAVAAAVNAKTQVVTIDPPPPTESNGVSYAPTFYPGTLTPGAGGTITIGAGEERSGVDFQMMVVPTVPVQGIVLGASGTLPPNLNLQLVNADEGLVGLGQASTRVTPDGRFTFRGVAPGQYVVIARSTVVPRPSGADGPPVSSSSQFGRTTVAVNNAPVAGVVITLDGGRTVSGRVAYDGAAKLPEPGKARMTATLSAVQSSSGIPGVPTPNAQVTADGRFTLSGVMPGRYTSSMVNGQDVLDFPLDVSDQDVTNVVVTFTDRSTELGGALQDAQGQAAPDYTVVVFAADSRYWMPNARRIQQTRPATDGRFLLRNLPPGDYLIAAVTDLEQGLQYDPEFLRTLAAVSTRISLGDGEKKTQDLRLAK
jgi:hypothetical protein